MGENNKLHIVMLPWLAFGHMIPYLELSKLIVQKGHKVSFVSTPRNIDRLPKLPPSLSSLIQFVKLPLPHTNNLPENAQATVDVPVDKVKYLKLAFDGLQEPLSQFLEESTPDWIFYDYAIYWLAPIASKFNVLTAFFSIFTAPLLGISGPVSILKGDDQETRTKPEDFTSSPKWVPFESTVAFRLFEIKRIFKDSVTGDEENVSDGFRLGIALENSHVIAVRSCYEFESEWLKLLEDIHQKPVFPVGQLPTTTYENSNDEDNTWREIKEWLDKQSKGSVVYVAFGSEAKPSQDELTAIALGLELSGLPFFWVLRTRRGELDTEVIELPKGFEERTKGHGIVCTSWAPQLKILSHDSVGGFLTHSGWSSVVEAIQFGRPLVLLTFLADQGINAKVLVEKKIGLLIPRNEEDGSFTMEAVAKSLNMVINEEEGRIYRDTIKEVNGLFCDPVRQDYYVDNLLTNLQIYTSQKTT
uniref:Glucosyltransferase 26 n=1 Tax=Nemophila menziesii TaxID=79376 RepID=A0A387II20_NEMME|nr:glucosyltransferase 26 [Nemophila menziesii]